MDEDVRLNGQLKSLGKKLFQFRDLVAKMDIPETLPDPPYDQLLWETFVKKCSSAVTVLKQVHSALTPDMYHLSVYPVEKIWRNPAAVPELLSVPARKDRPDVTPIARSAAEVQEWNSQLEQANIALEELLSADKISFQPQVKTESQRNDRLNDEHAIIARLFTKTSRQRASEDAPNSEGK